MQRHDYGVETLVITGQLKPERTVVYVLFDGFSPAELDAARHAAPAGEGPFHAHRLLSGRTTRNRKGVSRCEDLPTHDVRRARRQSGRRVLQRDADDDGRLT